MCESLSAIGCMRHRMMKDPSCSNRLREVLGPLQLPITGDTDRLGIGVEETGVEFIANHQYLLEYLARAALMCLVMANEITLGKPYRTNDPISEFLRHCRNAAGMMEKSHSKMGGRRIQQNGAA